MPQQFDQVYRNQKVLVTGHTGFKGSWLSIWLNLLGAQVIGYSLPSPTTPNLFDLTNLDQNLQDIRGDIRDLATMQSVISKHQPDFIFHLAAQPIVLHSYEQSFETFSTNSHGTVTLLEAAKKAKNLKGIIVVTTDKCYDNHEWIWGYRENDALGGKDPYSASKAMAELAAKAYRESFQLPIATARAGNVIGGGDFSDFRIVPDTMKALMDNCPVTVRMPNSTRPWLYVLDALHGYLLLGQNLIRRGMEFADAWNFGPKDVEGIPVKSLVEQSIANWGSGDWIDASSKKKNPEMHMLKLNWDKAASKLGWSPAYDWRQAISDTVEWYKRYPSAHTCDDLFRFCTEQIHQYEARRYHEIDSLSPEGCLSY